MKKQPNKDTDNQVQTEDQKEHFRNIQRESYSLPTPPKPGEGEQRVSLSGDTVRWLIDRYGKKEKHLLLVGVTVDATVLGPGELSSTPTSPKSGEGWVEDFYIAAARTLVLSPEATEDLKAFITQLLALQKAEIREKVEKLKNQYMVPTNLSIEETMRPYRHALDEVLKLLEK
jgi:hypothetical protein